MELPEITDVQRLTLRPGDRLVVRAARTLNMQEMDQVQECLERYAPGVPVLVLGPGDDIEVIGPPDGVHVELNGDPGPAVATLRQYIRQHGGSVQQVLGR